jgi:hypothetical protein
MTPDTYYKYPDLKRCTFLARNQWTKQELSGGKVRPEARQKQAQRNNKPRNNKPRKEPRKIQGQKEKKEEEVVMRYVGEYLWFIAGAEVKGRHFMDAYLPGWSAVSFADTGRMATALKPELARVVRRALDRIDPDDIQSGIGRDVVKEMVEIVFDDSYDSDAPILPENVRENDEDEDEGYEEEANSYPADYMSIGFYLVEGTACVASIELHVHGTSIKTGDIYALTHTARQKMDLYSLTIAATVIYTAKFPFLFRDGDARPAKLDQLHSQAIVVPSMWVLRPYEWLLPTAEEFNKEENDTYEAYQQYYDASGNGEVNITLRLGRDNVAAAGRVLHDLCAKKKFCHTRPRLDARLDARKAKTKADTRQRKTAGKQDTTGIQAQGTQSRKEHGTPKQGTKAQNLLIRELYGRDSDDDDDDSDSDSGSGSDLSEQFSQTQTDWSLSSPSSDSDSDSLRSHNSNYEFDHDQDQDYSYHSKRGHKERARLWAMVGGGKRIVRNTNGMRASGAPSQKRSYSRRRLYMRINSSARRGASRHMNRTSRRTKYQRNVRAKYASRKASRKASQKASHKAKKSGGQNRVARYVRRSRGTGC